MKTIQSIIFTLIFLFLDCILNASGIAGPEKIKGLALYGDLDKQVIPDLNIRFVEEAFKNGKCKEFELIRLPGLNHMFQTATTGSEYEYTRIEETFSPDALNLISDWIEKTAGM